MFAKCGFLNQIQHMLLPELLRKNLSILPSETDFKTKLISTEPRFTNAKVS